MYRKIVYFAVLGVALLAVGGVFFVSMNQSQAPHYVREPEVPPGYELVQLSGVWYGEPSLKNATTKSAIVVRGKVSAVSRGIKGDIGAHRKITLQPVEFLKNKSGINKDAEIIFEAFGGTVDKTIYWFEGQAEFAVGEEVVVWLDYDEVTDVHFLTYGNWTKQKVENGKLIGERMDVDKGVTTLEKLRVVVKEATK